MCEKITILNLEDDVGDAELIKETIKAEHAGWEVILVTTGVDFEREVIKDNYDIILSDYKVPGYSGIKALEFVKSRDSVKPFIIVSGSMGEEFAVEMIKKGATDYVLKDKLIKLPAAIIRALNEAKAKNEMLEMERRLRESEEKFRQIIETALVGVYQTNEKGEIKFANRTIAQILDFSSPDELKQHNSLEFYQNQEERKKLVELLKSKGKASGFEAELVTKKKRVKNVLMSVNYLGDSYTGMMLDVTDRRKYIEGLKTAKERAENLNKIKSNFLGTISHEMRTPMIGILGFTDILRKEVKDKEHKEVADIIYESSQRLMNTLNQILDLSRVESNKQELQLCDVKLSDTILSAIEVMKGLAKEKDLYLVTDIKEPDIIAHLDESLLIKVIHNLIDNAIKFTNKGGVKIELESRKLEGRDYAVIKVIDTGIGIDELYHSIIFEEFRQVSEGLSRSFEGTGLGLTISKKYVELMGGKISVNSSQGKGSTFEVIFPIVNAKEAEGKFEPKTEKDTEEFNDNESQIPEFKIKPKILQVEDDWASRMYVKKCLDGIAELEQAQNAEEALELVKNQQFDIILMDINLKGGINGLEITEKIRNLSNYEITPIVAVTAFAMKGDKEEFLSKGCTHYLSKPFHKEELIELISMLISG